MAKKNKLKIWNRLLSKYNYWEFIMVAPVLYGLIATYINSYIGKFGEPLPSFWFGMLRYNLEGNPPTSWMLFGLIGFVGFLIITYKIFKYREKRWIRLSVLVIGGLWWLAWFEVIFLDSGNLIKLFPQLNFEGGGGF